MGVGDCGEHFVSGVDAVLLCHAFLELGKEPVDEWEVFSCVLIGGGVGVSQEDGLVSLGVEFDADDLGLFLVEGGKERCAEVEDMAGSDEGDHSCGRQMRWAFFNVCVETTPFFVNRRYKNRQY